MTEVTADCRGVHLKYTGGFEDDQIFTFNKQVLYSFNYFGQTRKLDTANQISIIEI